MKIQENWGDMVKTAQDLKQLGLPFRPSGDLSALLRPRAQPSIKTDQRRLAVIVRQKVIQTRLEGQLGLLCGFIHNLIGHR